MSQHIKIYQIHQWRSATWGKEGRKGRKSKCLLTYLGASAILSPLLFSASLTTTNWLLHREGLQGALLRRVSMSF